MAGLLLELRRQIRNNRRKNANNNGPKTSKTANQKNARSNADAVVIDREPDLEAIKFIYERNLSIVSKDDILLKQIDEFRERAQQLQDMLDSRESQAEELQSLVDERKEKAQALDQILKERQEQADGVSQEVERHIDALIQKVAVRLEQIESSIKNDVGAQMDRLESSLRNDVGAKIDRLGMMANNNDVVGAQLEQLEATVKADLTENLRASRQQAMDQTREMKEALTQIQSQLDTAKSEISDKVHSETVNCYRNIKELYKGMDERLDRINQLNDVEESVKGSKQFGLIAMILAIVNLVGIIGVLLASMGILSI